jgi:hypothetical protein
MSNKPAKFAWAIFVAFVAGLAFMTVTRAASAADECLTEPKGPTPSGKHWRYHIEHGTGRHCWYLRDENDPTASTAVQDQSADASDDASSTKDQAVSARDQAAPSKPPAKKIETPTIRSIADARAEWPARAPAEAPSAATPVAPPAPPSAANTSVFPDPQAALAAKPVVDPSSASSSDTDTQPDTTASIAPAPAPAPAPVTQASQLGDRHLGSIPMLLLVAFGALGLAGLTGSTVYRLASLRRPSRREDRWSRNIELQPPAPARHRMPIAARPEPIQEDAERENFDAEHLVFESEHRMHEPVEIKRFEPRPDVARTDARTVDSNRRRDRTPMAARPEPIQERFEQEDFQSEHLVFESEHRARKPIEPERFEPRREVAHTDTRTDDVDHRRREQIEVYLAQLTRQLRADLEAAARAE